MREKGNGDWQRVEQIYKTFQYSTHTIEISKKILRGPNKNTEAD